MSKVKHLNIVDMIVSLLEDGVAISIVKKSLRSAGLSEDEVEFLIGYISETESNRLINIANQYIDEMKKGLNDVIKILSEAD